ncbi:unnamed protein product [Rotaria socialis]|uniref:Peptidase S1 domain-containing protein n=2 Tax=Rotaria socialis TaxID=392032 RepID=A0A818HLJ5_9BILA|nr:unnamed protein product [Rotaria socialis]
MEFRFIRILLLVFIWVPFVTSYYECNQRLVLCGCGLKNVEMNVHIANGEDAVPHSWPMIVSLRYDCLNNGNVSTHCCSGTILSDSYILTAAHCVENINESSLLLGKITIATGIYSRSQQCQTIRKVDQIFIHPNWTAHVNGFRNDIAILHLTESLDFSTNLLIARTCLPSQSNSTNDITKYPPSNSSLVVIGWNFRTTLNSTARDILQQATLISIHHNHSSCAASINHIETQFCAGRYEDCKGTCMGDSGGPILRWIGDRWEQVGIVSYGLDNCESANHQMIFTRITAYYDWIERVMNQRNSTAITTAATATATAITTAITTINRPLSVYRCSKNNTLCGCGFNNVALTTTRIVGGEEAIPYSWSMIVSLRYDCLNNGNFTTHCCGGTILNSYYILTAAHCVDKINLSSVLSQNITIAAGIHNLTEINQTIRRIDQIFIHSDYTGLADMFKNDIAILHLSEPLDLDTNSRLSRTCRSSRVYTQEDIRQYPSNGSKLAVVGWGLLNRPFNIKPQLLQQLNIYAIHHIHPTCAQYIGYVDVQFCAGVYDDTKGDSGGPVMQWLDDHWEQVGIASYVVRGCASYGYPSVYTRLASFHDWIEWIINPSNYTTTTTTIAYRPPNVYSCNNRNTSCGCSKVNVAFSSLRIIGGGEAVPYSWSMIVSLRYDCLNNGNFTTHCCGGTILNSYYILTAAHCVDKINLSSVLSQNITIAAGIHNLTEINQTIRRIDQIFIHSDYTGLADMFKNDIAILHLSEPLDLDTNSRLSRTCRSSRVYTQEDIRQYPSNGSKLAVVGWGLLNRPFNIKPQLLQQLNIYAIHHIHPTCAQYIGYVDVQFCAGVYDDTKGDSGGPVMQWLDDHWEQVGIASYVVRGCASYGYPSVYTRLASFHDWIEWIINPSNYTTTTTTIAYRPPNVYSCNNRNTSCGCSKVNVAFSSLRIIGGGEAVPYSWSMIVSLRYDCLNNGNFTTHCCGGTILNSYYILTAAHCVDKINLSSVLSQNITIAAGIHNLTEINQTIRRVDQIFIHPEYAGQQDLFKNDIAILHLSEPLDLDTNPFITQTCRPLRMNSSENIMAYPSNGSKLAVVGWGAANRPANIKPQLLQQLYIRTIHHNDSTCARSIGHVTVQFCGGVYEGGKGDSGGPIFEWLGDRWEQVGISSYMMNGCASVGYQSVFTRLAAFYDWIEEVINQSNATTLSSFKTSTAPTTSNTTTFSNNTTTNNAANNPNSYFGICGSFFVVVFQLIH